MKTQQRQFAFDKALHGVRKQGKLSIGLASCAYRSSDGTAACGIGHLIPDNLYRPEFDEAENTGVINMIDDSPDFSRALKAGGVDPEVVGVYFLKDLQAAHDTSTGRESMQSFERNMAALAVKYGLEYKEKS
jgi:hypothetical protein